MTFLKLNAVLLSAVVLRACGGYANVKTEAKIDTEIHIGTLNIQ
jgi:hypothetical protein